MARNKGCSWSNGPRSARLATYRPCRAPISTRPPVNPPIVTRKRLEPTLTRPLKFGETPSRPAGKGGRGVHPPVPARRRSLADPGEPPAASGQDSSSVRETSRIMTAVAGLKSGVLFYLKSIKIWEPIQTETVDNGASRGRRALRAPGDGVRGDRASLCTAAAPSQPEVDTLNIRITKNCF